MHCYVYESESFVLQRDGQVWTCTTELGSRLESTWSWDLTLRGFYRQLFCVTAGLGFPMRLKQLFSVIEMMQEILEISVHGPLIDSKSCTVYML